MITYDNRFISDEEQEPSTPDQELEAFFKLTLKLKLRSEIPKLAKEVKETKVSTTKAKAGHFELRIQRKRDVTLSLRLYCSWPFESIHLLRIATIVSLRQSST